MNSELRKELMSIREKIDQALAEPEEKAVWKLKELDHNILHSGYILFTDGTVGAASIYDYDEIVNYYIYGSWFQTREKAELQRAKRKLLFEIKKWAEEQEDCQVNWRDDNEKKWFPVYLPIIDSYESITTYTVQYQSIFPHSKKESKYNEFMSIFGDRMKKILIDKEL